VRSTDTHPPHHAHFDIPEGVETAEAHHSSLVDGHEARSAVGHLAPVLDIEHVPVDDDPREWSKTKKNLVLGMMTISVVSTFLPSMRWSEAELFAYS
jgi:hypothetical protein